MVDKSLVSSSVAKPFSSTCLPLFTSITLDKFKRTDMSIGMFKQSQLEIIQPNMILTEKHMRDGKKHILMKISHLNSTLLQLRD